MNRLSFWRTLPEFPMLRKIKIRIFTNLHTKAFSEFLNISKENIITQSPLTYKLPFGISFLSGFYLYLSKISCTYIHVQTWNIIQPHYNKLCLEQSPILTIPKQDTFFFKLWWSKLTSPIKQTQSFNFSPGPIGVHNNEVVLLSNTCAKRMLVQTLFTGLFTISSEGCRL